MEDSPRVIVADDDPLIRKLLRDLLRQAGYRPTLCASGQAALDEVEAEEPELLITDLEMPGKSGLDVIRELRTKRRLLPVLLMSGAGDARDLPAALSHSGVTFLPKPFRVAECRRAIALAIGARR